MNVLWRNQGNKIAHLMWQCFLNRKLRTAELEVISLNPFVDADLWLDILRVSQHFWIPVMYKDRPECPMWCGHSVAFCGNLWAKRREKTLCTDLWSQSEAKSAKLWIQKLKPSTSVRHRQDEKSRHDRFIREQYFVPLPREANLQHLCSRFSEICRHICLQEMITADLSKRPPEQEYSWRLRIADRLQTKIHLACLMIFEYLSAISCCFKRCNKICILQFSSKNKVDSWGFLQWHSVTLGSPAFAGN